MESRNKNIEETYKILYALTQKLVELKNKNLNYNNSDEYRKISNEIKFIRWSFNSVYGRFGDSNFKNEKE